MSYVINRYNGQQLVVLQDGTIDTTTSLNLVGRNYVGYGTQQNENFVYLLENFANSTAPLAPITGQLWFDTALNNLQAWDGTKWDVVGAASLSSTSPQNPNSGQLWFNTTLNTLNVYDGAYWKFVGPEVAPGFGATRARSLTVKGSDGQNYPIIELVVNDTVIAITSNAAFTLDPTINPIFGFSNIVKGITVAYSDVIAGNLQGNASSATILATPRLINGVAFDGSQDVTFTANTTNSLTPGNYISGNSFNGSVPTTWSVNATSNNTIGTVVARDSLGNFSANFITANVIGNLQGNVSINTGLSQFNSVTANLFTGNLQGNSTSATQLATARLINSVPFDGTADITVTANAGTLTGSTLASGVTNSSLTNVGTLTSLHVSSTGSGITVGGMRVYDQQTTSNIDLSYALKIKLIDPNDPTGSVALNLLTGPSAYSAGGPEIATLAPQNNVSINLGLPNTRFNNIYSMNFTGDLIGNVLGNVTGNVTGNSDTATKLKNPRRINTVFFDGSQDISFSTSLVTEGSNLYYTDARARAAVSASGNISYDPNTGVFSYTQGNTDTVAEGATNKYYTDSRARNAISVSGGLSYNPNTGVINGPVLAAVATTGDYNQLINKPFIPAPVNLNNLNANLASIVNTIVGSIDLNMAGGGASYGQSLQGAYEQYVPYGIGWSSVLSGNPGGGAPTVYFTIDIAGALGLSNDPGSLYWRGNYGFNLSPSLTRVYDQRNIYYSIGTGVWSISSSPVSTTNTSPNYGVYSIAVSVVDANHPYHGTSVSAGWIGVASRVNNVYTP